MEIEPDDGIARTMPLSLVLMTERRQRQRNRLLCTTEQDNRGGCPDPYPWRGMVSPSGRICNYFEAHSLPPGLGPPVAGAELVAGISSLGFG
ncbi:MULTISPECIES: hypothetical protein [unclassified Bradyrhizobium]|uniref:hypothetical protein n=1 Tax=unclassified Bradyrhizobium TaxID=2631580 RepID=UPI001BA84F3F|nr:MULTISPECIES: hypothetical protein [unclassified Bradyrhizobium]MBR1202987.1 hypothetical protein [Bradyrhizobium sp. AUGA SZCCT0124]MBR1314401.1 hypothetical protein [Bradyrhizobium sp. AUGA SZCCT0051]MBR1342581.1 hypothetical protein [Bradyrhizobium sp. AUGA SZCCT0105]MBR1352810.1 hypothetical protein [Bradyrhizobium sp. AUGA SZCCT0045]